MGELILHRGTRDGFRALVEHLRGLLAGPADRGTAPVALVVGSSSQRRLLLPRLARELGGAVLGLDVLTPARFARKVLEAEGADAPLLEGETAFRLLVGRAVRARPALAKALASFEGGEYLASGAIRDLLGAGLDAAVAEPLLEAIEEEGLPRAVRARARDLVEAAVEVAERMAAWDVGEEHRPLVRHAERIALAADLLARPGARLPFRAVACWGLPDAPGRTADLLAAMLRHPGTTVFLDVPPDPADPGRPAPGEAFREAFRRSLESAAERVRPPGPGPGTASVLSAFHAVGPAGEAREIARRIRVLLDRGTAPEEIAVVARGLDELLPDLAAVFDEGGIPWSLFAPAPPGLHPGERVAGSAAALLEQGPAAAVDDWLDARGMRPRRRAELSLLLRSRGIVRLERLAGASAEDFPGRGDGVFLPVREPLGGEADRFVPRRIPRDVVAGEIEAARRFLERLRRGPAGRSPGEAAAFVRDLLADVAGSPGESAVPVEEVADALEERLPPGFVLEPREAVHLAAEILRSGARRRPGGKGAGVRVMSALRARGIPFRVLFLAGLCRGVFPRIVRDDPLLPDALRRRLRDVLPALPLPLAGHDEERWLFAHLVGGAEHVVLSWQRATADGAPRNPSPFVKGLELAGVLGTPETVPVHADPPRTLEELAVATGRAIRGDVARRREEAENVLAALLAGAAERWGAVPGEAGPREAAAARLRVLGLLVERPDPARPRRAAIPWFGFVVPGDPPGTGESPWVTFLEQLARCPWRAFLERVLRLAPPPDPSGLPPASDPRLVGSVVHRALAGLLAGDRVGGALPARLDDAVPLPASLEPTALDRALLQAAREILAEEGMPGEIPARGLARRARPFLEVALRRLEAPGEARVAGAEIVAEAGGARFRADLVLVVPDGLLLVDWKTGRPFYEAIRRDTLHRHFVDRVRDGELLQAAAYARLEAGGVRARGRYVYLAPALPEHLWSWTVEPGDTEVARRYDEAVRRLSRLAGAGPFFPRLVDRGTPGRGSRACERCEFRDACLAGESELVRRFRAMLAGVLEAPAGGAFRRLVDCWGGRPGGGE